SAFPFPTYLRKQSETPLPVPVSALGTVPSVRPASQLKLNPSAGLPEPPPSRTSNDTEMASTRLPPKMRLLTTNEPFWLLMASVRCRQPELFTPPSEVIEELP